MTNSSEKYWVYILLCENGSYYTGYTNNLLARYQSHVNGTGRCKYTRSFKPICIIQCWEITADKSLALKIERHIKKMSREQKEHIIKNPLALSADTRVTVLPRDTRLLCESLQ